MRALFNRLRHLMGQFWLRRSAERGQRRPLRPEERVVLAIESAWLLCVGVAVWMAFGEAPWWLAVPAVAVLWAVGGFFFLVFGLPVLSVPPILLLWAFPPTRPWVGKWVEPSDEWKTEFDAAADSVEGTNGGATPSDADSRNAEGGDYFRAYLRRPKPALPPLPVKTAGLVLIVALVASGRPVLAALYALPALGWLALSGLVWLLMRWPRRRGSRQPPGDP